MPRTTGQKRRIEKLLTFDDLPDEAEILRRVRGLCRIAVVEGATEAMIGGAPYLLLYLDPALRMLGVQPLYAYSKRNVEETTNENGDTVKRSVFRHIGFVRL